MCVLGFGYFDVILLKGLQFSETYVHFDEYYSLTNTFIIFSKYVLELYNCTFEEIIVTKLKCLFSVFRVSDNGLSLLTSIESIQMVTYGNENKYSKTAVSFEAHGYYPNGQKKHKCSRPCMWSFFCETHFDGGPVLSPRQQRFFVVAMIA